MESLYTLENKSGHIVKNRKKRKDEEYEFKMMKIDDRHKDYICQENSLQNNPRNVSGSVIIPKNVPNNVSTSMHFSNRNMLLFLDNDTDDDSDDSDSDGRGQGGKDVKGVENGIITGMNGQNVRAQPYSTSQRVDVRQRTGITDLMPLCVRSVRLHIISATLGWAWVSNASSWAQLLQ